MTPDATEERGREERILLERYHHDGNVEARTALVERFLPLARQLARRYQRPDEPLDDLVQVASVGLIKAIDRFDPERATAFSSFAVPTILGELKRYFRDTGWAVRVPRDLQELVVKVDKTVASLATDLGRAPSPAEIAEATGASLEDILEALEAAGAYQAVSLDKPRAEREDGVGETFAESLGDEDPGFEIAEHGATIAGLMHTLPARERHVLHLRFVEDLTQSEIGERIGVSQMHVSRLIRQALARLRNAAQVDPGAPA
jgi:RNA polymerase sigma-B factor